MRISDSLVESLLKHSSKVTDTQLANLKKQQASEKKPLQDIVIKTNTLTEAALTKLYADEIDIPLAELKPAEISHQTLKNLTERIARQYRAVVFDIGKDGSYAVAMEDPDDIQALNFLQKQLGSNIHVYIATSSQIAATLDQYRGNISGELSKVITTETDEDASDEEVDESELAEDSPIAQTVNIIIEYAVNSGASDIHIEPREGFVVVRYRVDGVLRETDKLPRKLLNPLISRIKILSNLKIDEHRAPQDGRFKVEVGGQRYALRVSVLPVVDGEKIVMRILNEGSRAATLDELGFWGDAKKEIAHAITQPHGMVLVTGPTGSGKSTTLFSVLSSLNQPGVNISTIEDPVEYRIQGVNQTQVNPQANMTFANGLRALLRQDPNIIMIGEVRDGETAELGVQAALTGHLVFTTLHTNDAATCLPRLLDMGIEPFLIASTVRIVLAQRLVRRLCPKCREHYNPDAAEVKKLVSALQLDKAGGIKAMYELEQEARKEKLVNSQDEDEYTLSTTTNNITRIYKASDKGCSNCNNSGYKGRIGIYEVLSNSESIQKLIIENTISDTIEKQAIKEGMLPMQLDGFVKALLGMTTIEEILRVTTSES